MIEQIMNPIDAPNDWHRFLYRSVLLEWETSLHKRNLFPRFNGRKPLAGIKLVKVDSLKNFEQALVDSDSSKQVESFVFYSNGLALKELLGLIRNCVAHGHYSCPKKGWIRFHHVYKNKTKLSGQAKFANLKAMVGIIVNGSHLDKGKVS